MSQYWVYRNPDGNGYLVDVQADINGHLTTKVVVPLLSLTLVPRPASRLNPLFDLNGETYVLMPQFMASVPEKLLKNELFSVGNRRDEIVAAIDLLLQGF